MNQSLYDQLRNAGGVLYYQAAAYSKIKNLQDEIEDDELAVEESESDITGKYPPGYNLKSIVGILLGLASGGIAGFCLIGTVVGLLSYLEQPDPNMLGATLFFAVCCAVSTLLLVVALVLIFSAKISRKKYIKRATAEYEEFKVQMEEKIAELNEQIDTIQSDLNEYMNAKQHYLEFLPTSYRNVMAVGFMLEAVQNLRADTLKEAINLYEQELKHMAAMEVAELQRAQNENLMYLLEQAKSDIEANNEVLQDIRFMQFLNMHNNDD